MTVSSKDKERLRELAKETVQLAKSEHMTQLKKLWRAHNAYKGSRPMITVEVGTFAADIIPQMQTCEGKEARELEYELLSKIVSVKYFKDDTVIDGFYPLRKYAGIRPFDIEVIIEKSSDKTGLGHHFVESITDLESDFGKFKKSRFFYDGEYYERRKTEIEEIFGNILPVKFVGGGLYCTLTQDIVHIMSMENMMVSMYDSPELFHKIMDMLSDDYVEYFKFQAQQGAIMSTTDSENVAQGTYAFTSELKNDLNNYKAADVWGFLDSQETVGVSPAMFEEFIFPYYYKVGKTYGLLSYGCCEPVHPYYHLLKKFDNLRKISISPWCDENIMGENLKNSGIIYHRKPSPNFLGVGNVLDESGLAAHIAKTVKAAKGCKLEFTQRDVYTVGGDMNKVSRYVKILRENTENSY